MWIGVYTVYTVSMHVCVFVWVSSSSAPLGGSSLMLMSVCERAAGAGGSGWDRDSTGLCVLAVCVYMGKWDGYREPLLALCVCVQYVLRMHVCESVGSSISPCSWRSDWLETHCECMDICEYVDICVCECELQSRPKAKPSPPSIKHLLKRLD